MPIAVDDLEWLGTWYQQQCNGKWEHQRGLRLQQLDGTAERGWSLRVDLRGTDAAGSTTRRMSLCTLDRAQWLRCSLNSHQFEGMGDGVESLIGVFRRWIEDRPSSLLEAASVL